MVVSRVVSGRILLVVVVRAIRWVIRVIDLIIRVRDLRDLVLAAEFVNTDLVTPTGLHPAIVLVAEGFLFESYDAGTRGLHHSWAFVEARRAVVVIAIAWLVGLSTIVWMLTRIYFYVLITTTVAISFIVRCKSFRVRLGQESIELLDPSNHLLVLKLNCHAYRDKQASH